MHIIYLLNETKQGKHVHQREKHGSTYHSAAAVLYNVVWYTKGVIIKVHEDSSS